MISALTADLPAPVRRQLLDTLFEGMLALWLMLGGGIGVGLAAYAYADLPWMLAWTAAFTVASLLRMSLVPLYRRGRDRVATRRWVISLRLSTWLVGGLYGSLATLLWVSDDPALHVVVMVLCLAVAGGTLNRFAADPTLVLGQIALVMLPGIVVATWRGAAAYMLFAPLAAIYAVFLIATLRTNHATLLRLYRLNHDRGELVAELARQRDHAEAAGRARSQFFANMSHELRTPLNAIIGFAEVMKDELLGPHGTARYKEYSTDIHASGSHLLAIINDILDIGRSEAGKMVLDERPIPLRPFIDDILRLMRPTAAKYQVALTGPAQHAGDFTLRADEVRLRQVLFNLISNALKFTRKGGRVDIQLGDIAGSLRIVIADTGIGIAPEELSRILEPYGRSRQAFVRDREGAGLGLTLTKALVEAHGGRLDIESTLGKGTTVTVSFPPERSMAAAGTFAPAA